MSVPPQPVSLLVVDDDDVFRERLGRALVKRGYEVVACATAREALDATKTDSPERAIVDLRLDGEWGLHVVRDLLEVDPHTKIIVLTAYGSIATALEAIHLGAKSFLQKPVTVDEIEHAFDSDQPVSNSEPIGPEEVPSLARAEWEHINRVLTECDGNIRKAARLLGLHRRTLQRKLAKFPVAR